MKKYLPYSLILAAAATGLAHGAATAYTTPVGYVSKALVPNGFSFVGLTVHNPVISSGVIDAKSANSITDTGMNFTTLLTAGMTYVLELDNGIIQEVTTWNSSGVLNLPEDITASVTNGTTTYKLRKASTISDIFGATNSAGLAPDTDGDFLTLNDLIFVIGAGGAAKAVYYYNDGSTTGWFDADGNDGANIPIVYSDGFYVKRGAGTSINLVTSGEVKTKPTKNVLIPGFNFLSSVSPTGLTLGTSGLQNFISPDTIGDYQTVDNVYLPQPNGSFKIAYYFNDGSTTGWFDADGNDATNLALQGDFLILNRGIAKSYTISVPTSYSSL